MNDNLLRFNLIIWMLTTLAILVGFKLTGSANCLWAFFIPALCMVRPKNDCIGGKENDN